MRRRSTADPERAKSRRRKTIAQKRRGLRNPSAADHKTQSDVAQLTRERDEALEREKATAIENTRLFEEVQARTRELQGQPGMGTCQDLLSGSGGLRNAAA